MNKKTIAIIIGAIIIVIFAITGMIYYLSQPQIKTCQQINEELYNYVLAQKNQDISYCAYTGNPEFCKAHVKKDTSFCNSYENPEYCKAIITGNEDLCPENDTWCKIDTSKNPEYCKLLPENEQEQCRADIALNEQYYKQENLC